MIFDECVASPASPDAARAAMERTLRWAVRGRARFEALRDNGRAAIDGVHVSNPGQAQFGIVQGGVYPSCARRVFGGPSRSGSTGMPLVVSVWASPSTSCTTSSLTPRRCFPTDRPRYLMGTGMPDDLVECVARGVDMFDCVLPTRNARNGQLLTREGRIVDQERAIRRRPEAARPGLRVLHVPPLLTRVSPPSVPLERDDRGDSQHGAQSTLLP